MESSGTDSCGDKCEAAGQAGLSVHLAPELWLHIFEIATHVPGDLGLEISSSDPFYLSQSTHGWEPQGLLMASMSTRCSLVRVCREWRSLATPILYRVVIANHQRGLRLLHRTLVAAERPECHERAALLRACVRRFYCIFNGHWMRTDNSYPYEYLAEIVRALPNIANFTIRTRLACVRPCWYFKDTTVPWSVLSALADCGASLRVLEWDSDVTLCPRPDEFRKMLSQMPGLQILKFGKECPLDIATQELTPLVLPNLSFVSHKLFSPRSPLCLGLDRFDSLQELFLQVPPKSLDMLTPPVASQISRLTLRTPSIGDSCTVQEVVRALPNLQQLVLWYSDWHLFPPNLWLSNIERLGLGRDGWSIRKDNSYDEFLDSLSSMKADKLSAVRFLGPQDAWSKLRNEEPGIWARFQGLARSRGFRFEDSSGKTMQ
ncbi:hypothetical protein GLOTRDRAFT_96822 [Gloeophyllum trabeum ATCC 11539]|uniref:F-box domain-containing protein n=1 Tax=Gloeophyllum trabeum (strain ATCC 11539 / FP-39264 / Madison 617) TaxID=670483 RepID=S7R9G4_GLOTA|nr:uncharacterized protein GLOTRDRAFT_96822 [Gloeophyllum trabeum ATCC 11539]EPQ50915.1 hypothetical protein GLOTRDRAFT_96822 [Gloeophyllum trabeum ATCC 11539]